MTLPPTIPNELLPTQADRDAAEAHYPKHLWRQEARDDIAIAFAKHRVAAEASIVAWLRAESARIQELMSDDIGMTDMRIGVQLKIDKLADAIERGDHYAQ